MIGKSNKRDLNVAVQEQTRIVMLAAACVVKCTRCNKKATAQKVRGLLWASQFLAWPVLWPQLSFPGGGGNSTVTKLH